MYHCRAGGIHCVQIIIRVDLYQKLNMMLHSQMILSNYVSGGIYIFTYTKAWLVRDLKRDARLQNTNLYEVLIITL